MSTDGTRGDYVRSVAEKLSHSQPIEKIPESTAAVAVIFESESFLLIKRAERLDDPWSGQVAFPGGHVQADDATFLDAASREAREEVGLSLKHGARFLGYMEDFEPRNRKIPVVPCVFQLTEEGVVRENSEVSSYRWVPFASLSVQSRETYILDRGAVPVVVPAFRFGDYVVWGLTERILTKLGEIAGISV